MTMADEARIERCERENEMMENVKEFLKDGCKCSRGPKDGPCSSQFTEEVIIANLNNCHKLSSRELDFVILANIQAVTRVKNAGQKRNRSPRCNFLFQSKPICRHVSGHVWDKFCRLHECYENSGLSSRTHGNTKRLPQNALPYTVVLNYLLQTTQRTMQFRYLVTKIRTSNFCPPMKQRSAYFRLSKRYVKLQESRL